MDGDLQNDPADIPLLLAKLDEGYDAVLGLRAQPAGRLPDPQAAEPAGQLADPQGDRRRRSRTWAARCGPCAATWPRRCRSTARCTASCRCWPSSTARRLAQVPVRHHPRTAGKTKYNLTRTVRVVLDLITVKFLHSYLTRPMHVMGLRGPGRRWAWAC